MSEGDGQAKEPAEALDELEEDSIIATAAVAHSPKPRQSVRVEVASVVISEGPEEPAPRVTRQTMPRGLTPYRPNDTTVVIGRAASPAAKKAWVPIAIWGGAGAVAFGLGGIIATATSADSKDTGVAVPLSTTPVRQQAKQAALPRPLPPPPADDVDEPDPVKPEASAAVLSPKELPVDRAVKRPAMASKPVAAPPLIPAKPKVVIPSGI